MTIPDPAKLHAMVADLIHPEYDRTRHVDSLSKEEREQLERRGKSPEFLEQVAEELEKLRQIKANNNDNLYGTRVRAEAAEQLGVRPVTVSRWLKKYEALPHVNAIADKKRGRPPGQDFTEEQEIVACYLYLNPEKKVQLSNGQTIVSPARSDVTYIFRVLNAFFPPPRSYHAVYRYLKRLEKDNPLVVALARKGAKYIEDKLMPTPGHNVERPNARWQIDARPLPIYVWYNGIKTTVSLLLLIDHYSHYPIRARLVPRKEPDHTGIPKRADVTLEDVGILLASAMYDIDMSPESLYSDNGSENVGVGDIFAQLRSGDSALLAEYVRRIRLRPRGGGAVEAMLWKFDEVLKDLPANLLPAKKDPDKDNHFVIIGRALDDEAMLPLEAEVPGQANLKQEIDVFIKRLRKEPKRQNRKKLPPDQQHGKRKSKAKTREELWTSMGAMPAYPIRELMRLVPPARRISTDVRIDHFKIRFLEDEHGGYHEPLLRVDEDWDRWLMAVARDEHVQLRAVHLDIGWRAEVCLDQKDQYWCELIPKDDQKVDVDWRMERIRASLKRIRAQHADLFAVLQPLAEHYELDTISDTPGGRELVWDRQPDEVDAQREESAETTATEPSAPLQDETKADKQREESAKEEQTVSARTRPRPASSPTSKLDWGDGDLDEEIRRAIEQHNNE